MGLIIGLTGGIGSGKTTIANLFAEKDIDVIDADEVARQVVKPNTPALASIIDHFGKDIVDQKGQLNRAELRQRIFNDPQEKQWLEALLHPIIRKTILEALENSTSIYTLLVAPLMLETGLEQHADKLLVIDVPESIQIARTIKRDNNTEAQIQAIINSQVDRKSRLAKADFVVDNTQTRSNLLQQIDALDKTFRALAEAN